MEAEFVELLVPFNAEVAGKRIHNLKLPADCLITMVCRNEKFILAGGNTVIEEGDLLLALVAPGRMREVQEIILKQKAKPDEQ